MKKLFALILGISLFSSNMSSLMAQTPPAPATEEIAPDTNNKTEEAAPETPVKEEKKAEAPSGHQVIKNKFIEGDPIWMAPVLICLLIIQPK